MFSSEYFEQYAEDLLVKNQLWDHLPINISKLLKRLNFIRVDYDYEADFLGAAFVNGDQKIVAINQNQSIPRKRFTIAHEIAHLLLHSEKPMNIDKKISYFMRTKSNMKKPDCIESEANEFAATILIPKKHLQREIESGSFNRPFDEIDINKLAKIFKVSPQVMSVRLQHLDLL